MKRKLALWGGVLLIVLLICSCSSVGGIALTSVPSENTEQTVSRGKTYQHAEIVKNVDISVYAQPSYEGDEVQFTVGIMNNSESDFFLSDTDFELYKGNYETGKWNSLGRWNAATYYQEKYQEMKTEETLMAITGALSVIDSAFGNTSYSTVSSPYLGTTTIKTRTYSPAETGLTAIAASSYLDSLASNNRMTLANLQSSLLYSSDIPAKASYAGNVMIEADNKSPEYMLSFNNGCGEPLNFIFSRSDRDSVANPWSDQTRDRHSIVLSHAIPQDRWQATYYWSRKEKVGMYVGLSLYNIFYKSDIKDNLPGMYWEYSDDWDNFTFYIDPDPNDEWNEDWRYEGHVSLTNEIDPSISVGFPVGITYRVFPNSWLIAGIELGFNDNSFQKVNIQYRNPDGEIFNYEGDFWRFYNELSNLFYAAPQIGFNFIFNWLDVSAVLTYRYPLDFYFDVGIGIAF